MRKSLIGGLVLSLLSSSIIFSTAHADDKKIRIGFNPGLYKEQFQKGVEPYLVKKGYKVEYKDFSDGVQVNDAVSRGNIDHLMLQMHDAMKADMDYQKNGQQVHVEFPPGSSWICFSDQTPHAAMGGQFMLEQTFLLPVDKMQAPEHSPLKVLESIMNKTLI